MPEDPEHKPDPKEEDDGSKPPPKTFTQEEVNRMMAKEKNDGRRSATNEILEKFGVKTVEEAEAILQKMRDSEEAEKTEAQKAKEAAEKEKAEAEKERQSAKRDRLETKIERALLKAGVEVDILERAVRLVDVEDLEADQDTVQAAVDALKEDMPQLFTPSDKKTDPKPPGGDPGRPPRNGNQKPNAKEEAQSILAKRHPKTVKSTT
jgi:hypothetical protein